MDEGVRKINEGSFKKNRKKNSIPCIWCDNNN